MKDNFDLPRALKGIDATTNFADIETVFDNFIDAIYDDVMSDETKATIINLPKYQQMRFVYSVLKHFAKGKDTVLSYKPGEPFKTMGSVSIETKKLDFDNPEWFARAAEFASNTEVYPLTKNRIRLTFTFHGITTPIE